MIITMQYLLCCYKENMWNSKELENAFGQKKISKDRGENPVYNISQYFPYL